MTTETLKPMREIVCCNCGEPTGQYSREVKADERGRCCQNLPARWPIGGPDAEPDYDEEPAEDYDRRPRCSYCDARNFRVVECQYVSYSVDATEDQDLEDPMLHVPSGYGDTDTDHAEVNCASCGREWNGSYEFS